MKTILILGAAGFVGMGFARYVHTLPLGEKPSLIGFDRALPADAALFDSFFQGDACDSVAIDDLLKGLSPDYVLHLVGTFSAKSFDDYLRINLLSGRILLEAFRRRDFWPKKILFVGSAAEYGLSGPSPIEENAHPLPVNDYGLTKLFQTELALFYHRIYGAPCVIGRTFNILGDGISDALAIGSFQKQIRELESGGTLRVGNLESRRDYLNIEEVAAKYWLLLTRGLAGEIYNVCEGASRTVRSVLDEMIASSGKEIKLAVDATRFKQNDIRDIYGSISKIETLKRL